MRKRFVLLTALLLTAASPVFAAKELFSSPQDLENFNDIFYEAPITPVSDVVKTEPYNASGETRAMPMFKKMRIKMTNHFRLKDLKNAEKILEQEKEEQTKLIKNERIDNEVIDKHLNIKYETTPAEENSENTIELQGGVKEHVTSNDALLDADNVDFDNETKEIIATGHPVLVFPPQGVTLKADKMVYNRDANILKAYGNVEVIRDGDTVKGDYMQVNMNEENSFMENINAKKTYLTVKARTGKSEADKIYLYNGKIVSEESNILNFHTQMIGGNNFYNMMVSDDDRSSLADEIGDTAITIKAKDVYLNAKKDHDVITLKKAKIFYGKHELFTMPSFTAHTNKKQEYFEANYPEFGSRTKLGMFIGPGFVFDVPNGAIVKVMPILNYKDKIGFGGAIKYRSGTNMTEAMYGSSNDIFVLRGKQILDDKLYLQYGANTYLNDWWFGMRMPKYSAELIYKDKTIVPSTIRDNLNLSFEQRASFGYMQDNDLNRYGESLPIGNIGTTRTRYMAQAVQDLYSFTDKENLIKANVAFVMQGSAALYGTGDTQFVGRVGPRFATQYKNWMQDITYFMSAYQDGTPMPVYDAYRYGHSNVYIREAYRVNKWLTLAWSGSLNFTDDSPNGKMFQENSFIVAFGPDDVKVTLAYDVVRGQTYFGINVLMDTKGSSLEFEKMEIKNPDRLAKNDKKDEKLVDYEGEELESVAPVKKMMYAQVIDIEDPDREDM
ncbi:MAG: LptA/OstA family protein [Candidatus Gastranaerophilaceae bacterium]